MAGTTTRTKPTLDGGAGMELEPFIPTRQSQGVIRGEELHSIATRAVNPGST